MLQRHPYLHRRLRRNIIILRRRIPHDIIDPAGELLDLCRVEATEGEASVGEEVDVFAVGEGVDLFGGEEGAAVWGGGEISEEQCWQGRRGLPVHPGAAPQVRPIAWGFQLVGQMVEKLFTDTLQTICHRLDFRQPVGGAV